MAWITNILPVIYFALIVFYLWKRNPLQKFGIKPYWSIGIFTMKVLSGVIFWFIYTYYYTERSTCDAFRFFDDAKIMHGALLEDPVSYFKMLLGIDVNDPALQKYVVKMFNWDKEYNYFLYNDSRTMLRFNTVCYLFSFGNYHVHTIMMSLLSLVGCFYLFKAFYPFLTDKKHILFLAVTCIPSVMFYSSAVLKEGILMAGIGFFFYAFFNLGKNYKKIGLWLLLMLSILILSTMKIYFLICLVPGIIYYLTSKKLLQSKPFLLFVIFHVSAFLGLVLLREIDPGRDIFYMLYKKKDDFVNVAMMYEAGSFFNTPDLRPHATSFMLYIPFAILTMLLRPYVWEPGSPLLKLAAIENILIFICLFIPIFAWKKRTVEEKRLTYFLITVIFYLYILIGFTTPVLGALNRYKVPALPLLLIVVLLFIDTEKLRKFISFKHL